VLVHVDDDPEVLAVIPTIGTNLPRLGRCLEALTAQTSAARLAVVIVLNTPDDIAIAPAITRVATVLRPGLNLGWAGGLHLGRTRSSTAALLWLVQDDMTPEPGCLDALEVELRSDPKLGVVSPLVVDDSGLVPAGSCGGVLTRGPLIKMDYWYPAVATAPRELDSLYSLDYVPSRGMLVDLALWDQVGGMYPGYYPVLWADVDFCAATRETGRSFRIAPGARTSHEGGGSTPTPFGQLLFDRHRDLFRARWGVEQRGPHPERTPIPSTLAVLIADAAASLVADLATRYSDLVLERGRARELKAVAEKGLELLAAAPLAADLAAHQRELVLARERMEATETEIRELRASTSWRITRPLRALGRLFRPRR
jgi:GT2 family glycosyltransferase